MKNKYLFSLWILLYIAIKILVQSLSYLAQFILQVYVNNDDDWNLSENLKIKEDFLSNMEEHNFLYSFFTNGTNLNIDFFVLKFIYNLKIFVL